MTAEWRPDWGADRPGFVEVADHAKDEFHQRVFDHLQAAHGWGHSSQTLEPAPDRPFRVTELIANTDAGPHVSRLWVANARGGLVVWVVGTGPFDEREIALWDVAVAGAISKLGGRSPQAWRAFVAQKPAALPYMRFGLAVEADLGDFRMKQVGTVTSEFITHVSGVLAGEHVSALLQIDGVTDCWAWHGDGEASTSRTLRLIVAMLSLAWDTPWYLRDGPTDRVGATWHGASGPVSGSLYRWNDDDHYPLAPPRLELPGWFRDALQAARSGGDGEQLVERVLLMHHEGLLLAREHPSLALLAFVAAIESIAAADERLARCDTCRSITGSTARFKRAVGRVLEEDEAAQLAHAYDRRSRTVHDARLHGRENLSGTLGTMSLYEPDEAIRFEMGILVLAQKASRAIVWDVLDIPGQPDDPLSLRYPATKP